jgi:hypothetical protein
MREPQHILFNTTPRRRPAPTKKKKKMSPSKNIYKKFVLTLGWQSMMLEYNGMEQQGLEKGPTGFVAHARGFELLGPSCLGNPGQNTFVGHWFWALAWCITWKSPILVLTTIIVALPCWAITKPP